MIKEKNITRTQEYVESIINTVREPLLVLDQNLRVVNASRSFYNFFKVRPDQTVNQHVYDLGDKQWDIPKLRELLEDILPLKSSFDDYEVEHDFISIGRRTMLLNARQITRKKGEEQIILLAIEDITDRRRLEDLLADSEERYRRIFETASDGIILLEKGGGRIVQANPAAEAMMGYSDQECVGKSLCDIGIQLDTSDFQAIMHSLNNRGILNYDDIPIKTRIGKDLFADIYLVNRAKLAQCNIRDVSERKQMQINLQTALIHAHKEQAMNEAIIASMGQGLGVMDPDFTILYQNKFHKDLMGDQVGIPCFTAFEKRNQVCPDCPMATAFKDGGIHKTEKTIIMDGKALHLEFTASTIKDIDGNTVAGVEIVRDLTQQKKLETQLQQSQKMEAIGTLAGGIAHDFNNILSVIMGYGSMIMERLDSGSKTKTDMNELLTAAKRAVNLTNKLLVFSRKERVRMMAIDLNGLILGLEKMLCQIVRESTDLKLNLADGPLTVWADSGQLEQVLINLAGNARDAMPKGGSLTISSALEEVDEADVAAYAYCKPGRYVSITVSDTGKGISAETMKKMFEPFFTTKGVGEGTGLGLAISYGIVKLLGGYITVNSQPGQGAEFKIYLPLREKAALHDRRQNIAVSIKGGTETVLVAEDEASLRKLTKVILESSGYSVITAKDGDDTILQYGENRDSIDLILLDMVMPKRNGKETSKVLRNINPKIKILFTSGYAMDVMENRELDKNGFAFIEKPFQAKSLLLKVREILDG